jgi:pimeloyl-ACP methyl ester carboxylesterase
MGFRIIAIDAAAHGRTAPLARTDFRSNVDLLVRTLDKLGVRRAIVLGHSMGGRTAIELAASYPERLIAAVLVDAAAGDAFDEYTKRAMRFPPALASGLALALYDMTLDLWLCGRWRDRRLYGITLARAVARWGTQPHRLAAAVRSVVLSSPTGNLLRQARAHGVRIVVVHAENDSIIPWPNAVSMAENGGATLHRIPRACHSWMISDPRRGASTLAALISAEVSDLTQSQSLYEPGAFIDSLSTAAPTG